MGDEIRGQPGQLDDPGRPITHDEAGGPERDGREDPPQVGDPVEESLARVAAAYAEAGSPPIAVLEDEDEDEEPDLEMLLRMAAEHGSLTATVGVLAGQVRELRGALRRVLKATDRYSDSRRAPWWLEAHQAVSRSRES